MIAGENRYEDRNDNVLLLFEYTSIDQNWLQTMNIYIFFRVTNIKYIFTELLSIQLKVFTCRSQLHTRVKTRPNIMLT